MNESTIASKAWPFPRIVAHRGAGKLAPENTLAAMRCGKEHGFQAVEFDVMLSADQEPVLMHDEEFGRTIAGEGKVALCSAANLLQMDAGAWFSSEFQGEKVPHLQQVLEYCLQNAIWMNIEIKPAQGHARRTGEVVAETVLAAAQWNCMPRASWPLFSSFSFEALQAAQKAAPEIARGMLFEQIPANWREMLQELQATALHVNHQNLTAELASQIKQAGYGLFCYTVNDLARARELFEWG